MSYQLTLTLPEDLSELIASEAAIQSISPEELVIRTLREVFLPVTEIPSIEPSSPNND